MSGQDGIVRFTVSLPAELLAELDAKLQQQGYASRSEFVRDLIREKMVEARWADSRATVVGVLTISYDHHQGNLSRRLMDIQHNRYVNILYTSHVHLDHDHCLETIVLKGRPRELEQIAGRIGGLRGVRLAKLTRASPVEL